jgi:esterase/lipase superfamily enzyme
VLYGTDRVPLDAHDSRARFDNQGSESLYLRHCDGVDSGQEHTYQGTPRASSMVSARVQGEPGQAHRHCVAEQVDEEKFVALARTARERDGSNDEALLFIHGYKVGFEDSIRRAAQIAVDLEFAGLAIAYSWPSVNSLFGYSADANVSESYDVQARGILGLLRFKARFETPEHRRAQHGHRVLARALITRADRTARVSRDVESVVFAAPDIDPKTFGGFAKVFAGSCERCTLYASAP